MNQERLRVYKDALQVQDACNLSGVVHSWDKAVSEIWHEAQEKGLGTDYVNRHPVNVLFSSKVASLTGSERGDAFHKAYTEVERLVRESENVKQD